jgi:hypothetical protein
VTWTHGVTEPHAGIFSIEVVINRTIAQLWQNSYRAIHARRFIYFEFVARPNVFQCANVMKKTHTNVRHRRTICSRKSPVVKLFVIKHDTPQGGYFDESDVQNRWHAACTWEIPTFNKQNLVKIYEHPHIRSTCKNHYVVRMHSCYRGVLSEGAWLS